VPGLEVFMYVINERYRNSRQVDYNRWSDAAEVIGLVDVLVAGMKTENGIKKLDGYRFNMRTLLMELYHSYLTDKEQYIAFHVGHDHYKFKVSLANRAIGNRYNRNPHITHSYFTGCIDYLDGKDYIEVVPGGSFRDGEGGQYGYLSRMRATAALVALWDEHHFDPGMIKRFQPEETMILKAPMVRIPYVYKGKKRTRKYKALIPDYEDTRNVSDKRKAVDEYNLLLDRTYIDVDVDCITNADREDLLDRLLHAKDKYRYSINLGSKQVYRVFNNASFYEGGRYYGGWWIGCPSVLRKYITINGEPTVELDYSGIHIHLLYAFKRINFAELKTDAYELVENDPDRKLNKLILLTAYNADGPKDTASAVFNTARLDGTLHRYKLKNHQQIYDKLELLKQKHEPIKKMIANKFGSKLQYHDSCVLEQIIKHFTKYDIPILTVHDSIICQRRYLDFVRDKMLELYTAYINKTFNCSTKYQSSNPHAKHIFQHFIPSHFRDTSTRDAWKRIAEIKRLLSRTHSYEGKIPAIDNTVIEVSEESVQYTCSKRCKHAQRAANIAAGRRIFLGKIKIQYQLVDEVIHLEVIQ
jgi:hypothetical protein